MTLLCARSRGNRRQNRGFGRCGDNCGSDGWRATLPFNDVIIGLPGPMVEWRQYQVEPVSPSGGGQVPMAGRTNVPNRTLFIGDNLDALRGINASSVDLIYLDPPGNTGRTYSATEHAKARGVTFDDVWTPENVDGEWLSVIGAHHPDAYSAVAAVMGDSPMLAYLTYMTIRLVELKRILKPAGSIYLHSNPEVAPYLRTVMDRLFGRQNFRNEIVWKRPARRTGDRRWLPIHDTLLFYTGGRGRTSWNPVPQEHFADYWSRNYKFEDEHGRFQAVVLINKGPRGGDLGDEWRGIFPGKDGNHWSVSLKALRSAYPGRDDIEGLSIQEKLDLLDKADLIYWPPNGKVPRLKVYADITVGGPLQDILTTIDSIDTNSKDRTGWPLQKPEALLDLIIRVSSDPGDVVLDPFCGSGTTCVVAERLGRRWIGMEKAPQAEDVLRERLEREPGEVSMQVERILPGSIPDSYSPRVFGPMEGLKEALYEHQDGRCKGCGYAMPSHVLTVRRVFLMATVEEDPMESYILLCNYCSDLMSGDDMDQLELELYRRGIMMA